MLVNTKILQYVASDVLSGMLGIEFKTDANTNPALSELSAEVNVTGDWNAQIVVSTTNTGATQIAHCFFGNSAETLTREDLSDALGEVANMIGGNIKGLCWGETVLSIPKVFYHEPVKAVVRSQADVLACLLFGQEHVSIAVQHLSASA
jgi:CheY-specific phosphatase CheX